VGRFTIDFEVANNDDLATARRGLLEPDKVRRLTIPGVVDSGASELVLPQAVVRQLDLGSTDLIDLRYPDCRPPTRALADAASAEILALPAALIAVVEPEPRPALIGAIVLEAADLLVDCREPRLVPRDPRAKVWEIG